MDRFTELSWAAGLIEGEGSFEYRGGSPRISVAMTDLDVLIKLARIVGERCIRTKTPTNGGVLPQFHLRIYGKRAIALMMTIWPHMGARRQERISGILKAWKAAPIKNNQPHVDRVLTGKTIVWTNPARTA